MFNHHLASLLKAFCFLIKNAKMQIQFRLTLRQTLLQGSQGFNAHGETLVFKKQQQSAGEKKQKRGKTPGERIDFGTKHHDTFLFLLVALFGAVCLSFV